MPRIVDAQPTHIAQLLAKPLRQPNAKGWISSTGQSIGDSLQQLSALSPGYFRALLNDSGGCICLWGITPFSGWATIWLIAAEEAEPSLKTFADEWPEEVDLMQELHGTLLACTTISDRVSIEWLEAMGFERQEDFSFTDKAEPSAFHTKGGGACVSLPQ